MHRLPVAGLLLLATSPASCGAGESAGSAAVVRDSAGIRIVENARPAWRDDERWTVAREPALAIGVRDGPAEYQLYRVGAALRLGDGRIVVANGGTREIRYYDGAGRHLRTVGGRGAGPGEFRALPWISALPGDSILAWDGAQNRLTVFSPAGDLVGTARIEPISGDTPTPDAPFTAPYPQVRAAFADGSLLAQPVRVIPNPGDGVRRDSIDLVRYARDGAVAGSLGRFPGAEFFSRRQGDDIVWEPRVFGRATRLAVRGRELIVGAGDGFEVLVTDGARRQIFRRAYERRPVRPADIASYRERRLAASRDDAARDHDRRVLDFMPYPSELPPYRDVVADREGNVWVEHYRAAPGEPPAWSVFDAGGRWLGVVSMPEGLRVLEIGSDYVLGRWQDPLDVEYVRLHALTKPRG